MGILNNTLYFLLEMVLYGEWYDMVGKNIFGTSLDPTN